MEYQKYKNFISKHVHFNAIEWKFFQSRLFIKKFTKGETILHQGDTCSELLFITSGLARGYIIDESGKDFTWSIYFHDSNAHMTNLFLVEYDSFLHQKPSSIYIEALEDTMAIGVDYANVEFLYKHLKKGERFGRLMAEEAYSFAHNLMIERQTKSAKERFESFMASTPHLLTKVPQYHIATLLGITPQHLSRLKKHYD
jgi:CRP-like cAMP-binding protein